MYLLDTNICIDFLRGKLPFGYRLFKERDPRLFKISAVVEAELHVGSIKSEKARRNRELVEKFLLPFEVLPFTSQCARVYTQIRAGLERKGTPIGPNDLLIASTALSHGLILVANNVNEFKRVPGLALESWDEVDFSAT